MWLTKPEELSTVQLQDNSSSVGASLPENPDIILDKGSFLEYDWSDATFVFANSTCFDPVLMDQLGQLGKNLKIGAYFITLTKRLTSPYFRLIDSTVYTMSWGFATVHIHQREWSGNDSDISGGSDDDCL